MEQVISVRGLKKYFKEVKAVDDVSFQVERGELFGFLGVNGAGKSTTINMLCTLLAPTGGEAEICGYRLGKRDGDIRRRIGVVWQGNCLDGKLTVWENLCVRASLYGCGRREIRKRVRGICERLEIAEIAGRRYEKLSGGQKRRCEIAAALVNAPEVLFLDEPTTGLDPATRKTVWESLEQMQKEKGVTIFLTTHYMEEAARAAHIAVMDAGKIREWGTPFSLKERFARDKLKLVPGEGQKERLREVLERRRSQGAESEIRWKEGYCLMTMQKSLDALPILKETEDYLEGFELVQGTMDDVFLKITGKELETAAQP